MGLRGAACGTSTLGKEETAAERSTLGKEETVAARSGGAAPEACG